MVVASGIMTVPGHLHDIIHVTTGLDKAKSDCEKHSADCHNLRRAAFG